MKASTRPQGFTLIEVLIALVIVSLGMMAVKTQVDRYVLTAGFMENKTLASWIGANRLTEMSLQREWPELGTADEEIEYAGRDWHLDITVSETDVENLRRVDIDVSDAANQDVVIQQLSALIEPPPPAGLASALWTLPGVPGDTNGERSPDDFDLPIPPTERPAPRPMNPRPPGPAPDPDDIPIGFPLGAGQ